MKGLLGRKVGMSQYFLESGEVVPVTLIEAGPCIIVQIKTRERDGYQAVQMGFGEAKEKRLPNSLKGHFAKSGVSPRRYLAELRIDDRETLQIGQEVKADIFSEGEYVDITGVAKGKGFAGVMKRWGFHGRPASHGHHYHRAPGSIGASATPSRVVKGKKLPGQMGGTQATSSTLEVIKVEAGQNLLVVKGTVPGPKGSVVVIREAKRHPKPRSLKSTVQSPKSEASEKEKHEEKKEEAKEEAKEEVKEGKKEETKKDE